MLNVLAGSRSPAPKPAETALPSLTLQEPPQADVSRYDRLRQIPVGG